MYKLKSHTVKTLHTSVRIEAYCRGLFEELPSNKSVKKSFSKGVIRVNGKNISSSYYIKQGDEIELWDLEEKAPLPYDMPIRIVFEDDSLAVVLKPAGLPTSGNFYRTLENAIQGKLANSLNNPLKWPKPVHRLDSPTSGLVIVAKSIQARIELGNMLQNRMIQKTYCALLYGKIEKDVRIDFQLEGKDSITELSIIECKESLNNNHITKVLMKPITGRTHQLRKHAALIKHPIIGDAEYGEKGNVLLHKGLFLCAVKLKFKHPLTKEEINIEIEPPKKFDKLMEREFVRFMKYKNE